MSPENTQKPNSKMEDFGRKLDKEFGEAARKIEEESEKVITYFNNEVVPAIRNHSSKALHTAAEKLHKLAEYMDQNRSK